MARNALPILTAEPGLTHYLEEIRRFPMLERQEEYMLAKRWREHGDRDAAHKLVTSHLRLVSKIARDYRGYGLPISEAISEGNVGLMQAVERFEPEKGFRLATYAMWWIKAAIREDGDSGEWQDRLVDESADQETTLAASEEFDNRRKTLSDALTVLNERERRIFEARRLAEEQITLAELAEEFGLCRERVRQIEVSAFEKVQNAVKHHVAAMGTPAPQPKAGLPQPTPLVSGEVRAAAPVQ